jgi:hypothetical protein
VASASWPVREAMLEQQAVLVERQAALKTGSFANMTHRVMNNTGHDFLVPQGD